MCESSIFPVGNLGNEVEGEEIVNMLCLIFNFYSNHIFFGREYLLYILNSLLQMEYLTNVSNYLLNVSYLLINELYQLVRYIF